MARKRLKTGVKRGGGPPPGYRWNVLILDAAFEEAASLFTEAQRRYLASQVRELAREVDPTHSPYHSVDAIEDFHELRDKGGILGSLNARVFFHLDKPTKAIVILGAIVKQNDGPTPRGDRARMRWRLRRYLAGGLD